MVGVGGHALEPEKQHLHGRSHVRVRTEHVDAHHAFRQAGQIFVQGNVQILGFFPQTGGQGLGPLQGFGLHFAQSLGVEIHIGQGAEQGLDHEVVRIRIHNARGTGLQDQGRQTPQKINQLILNDRHIRAFAANTGHRAARSLGCLFTLIAKHRGKTPFPPSVEDVSPYTTQTHLVHCD